MASANRSQDQQNLTVGAMAPTYVDAPNFVLFAKVGRFQVIYRLHAKSFHEAISLSDSTHPARPDLQNNINSALLDAVLNTAVDAIIVIDHRGKIIHANRSVDRMFGYDSQSLLGKNVSNLMPEPDRSRHDGYIDNYHRTAVANIIGVGRQVLGLRADGSLVPIDLAISEVRVGDQVFYTGIMRDMTERHQTEAHLRETQQRLIQSERLAAIGQMVTGLAHESRNALQRSRACLDMLDLDLQSAPEQRDLVQRTRTALVELQTLYAEVSNYAAPIKLGKTQEQIYELCQLVWNNLQTSWASTGVKIIIDCKDCPVVYCDSHRVCQVIRNILENSLAVSPPNSTIHVRCRGIERDKKRFAQVVFTDNGPGLNEEQRNRIFDPFFTTKTKGTGLGLAISRRLVEAHAGVLYVGTADQQATDHSGATIVLELPA